MSTITFSWEFPNWTVTKIVGSAADVISEVRWILTASNGTKNISVRGNAKLAAPSDPTKFTPKGQVTPDQLIEWVKPVMGYDKYVTHLTQRLNDVEPTYAERTPWTPASPPGPVIAPKPTPTASDASPTPTATATQTAPAPVSSFPAPTTK